MVALLVTHYIIQYRKTYFVKMDPADPIDDAPGAAGGATPAVTDDPMDIALQWIGFDAQATRDRLRVEGFNAFNDLRAGTQGEGYS